jgi:GTP-binding protein
MMQRLRVASRGVCAAASFSLRQPPGAVAWWQAAQPWAQQWRPFSGSIVADVRATPGGEADAVQLLRCFAIIAHVDHGKTTLMDKLMRECDGDASVSGAGDSPTERALDSGALERERGITILAKTTSMAWKGHTLNAVDTPGHADFGGEVERVLGMVDGALLLVDAVEGPLAQTKYVVSKALRQGLRPILVLNKVDRDSVTEQRCGEVQGAIFDLFAAMDATDEQLDFPTLYASARAGWVATNWEATRAALAGQAHEGMRPLLDAIVQHVPPPSGSRDAPFSMVATLMEKDPYMGRMLTGRIASGRVRVGDQLKALTRDGGGASRTDGRVTRIMKRRGGFGRIQLNEASVGDIVAVAGLGGAYVTDTLAAMEVTSPLPAVPIDPPTLSMMFGVNDSPLAGKEGTQLTGSKIGSRLVSEAESNVSILVRQDAAGGESFEVQGRGELQLGILLETMRREGFELSVSPPEVLLKTDPDTGKTVEPYEEVTLEVNDSAVGPCIDALSLRGAEVRDVQPGSGDAVKARILLRCPARGLLGFRSEFATLTRGDGVMHRAFDGYDAMRPGLDAGRKGVLISMAEGTATSHALAALEPRGTLFIGPGAAVYSGMMIGECTRDDDLEVNPTKAKQLTNIRNTGSEEQVRLTPPRRFGLEDAIGYVRSGELIEVTPQHVRMRKRRLDITARRLERRDK